MKNRCLQCGRCCEVICLNISPEELEMCGDDIRFDSGFVKKFFYNISQEEALKINPYLKRWFEERGELFYYYKCMLYSKRLNKCRLYHYRTHLCMEYPWYNDIVKSNEFFYYENCGYVIDREIFKFTLILKNIIIRKSK